MSIRNRTVTVITGAAVATALPQHGHHPPADRARTGELVVTASP